MSSREKKNIGGFNEGNDDDLVTKSLVKSIYDKALRKRFSGRLGDEFGIYKTAPLSPIKKVLKNRLFWIISAILLLAASLVLYKAVYKKKPIPPYQLYASQYLSEPYGTNALILRGTSDSNEIAQLRQDAGQAYALKQYKDGVTKLLQIEELGVAGEEDYFYLGLSYLYHQPPRSIEAIEYLKKAYAQRSTYVQESIWYLALALVQDGQQQEARQYLQEIIEDGSNHYRKVEAKDLYNRLGK